MGNEFIKAAKKRIKKINNNTFSIDFKIPLALAEEYNLLIEYDIGCDDYIILEDCLEKTEDKFIIGSIVLSFNDGIEYSEGYNIILDRACQLEKLSNGESLMEEE